MLAPGSMQTLGIVAGEPSGDYLGATLVQVLKRLPLQIEVEGVAGPRLQEAGCRCLFPMDRLAVMGLMEVLGSYPQLRATRTSLVKHFRRRRPDLFIGVDSPDFNLDLELALRQEGIRTIHYVSPSVWAWRRNRLAKIARAADLVLTLFPFEEDFYREHGIAARCVGHPMADAIGLRPDRAAARRRLGLDQDGTMVAIMPGSRRAEIERLLPPFLLAAEWCRRQRPDIQFLSSLLTDQAADRCNQIRSAMGLPDLAVSVWRDRSRDVLEAADLALVASGTVTLEAMLLKCPMVVGYRLNPLTWAVLRRMVKVKFVSLPNLLAQESLVPECLQAECRPDRLGRELLRWLDQPERAAAVAARFEQLHRGLRRDGGNAAASAVAEILGRPWSG